MILWINILSLCYSTICVTYLPFFNQHGCYSFYCNGKREDSFFSLLRVWPKTCRYHVAHIHFPKPVTWLLICRVGEGGCLGNVISALVAMCPINTLISIEERENGRMSAGARIKILYHSRITAYVLQCYCTTVTSRQIHTWHNFFLRGILMYKQHQNISCNFYTYFLKAIWKINCGGVRTATFIS